MNSKVWTAGDIRAIARDFIEGRNATLTARGAYLRALIETAQSEQPGSDRRAQHAVVKAVHQKFYAVVREAIATDEIILKAGFAKRDVGKERNRRLNFARSSAGTIKRWLRDPDHDLMKLDPAKTTKSRLEKDAPLPKRQKLTPKRIQARAGKLIGGLLGFTREIAKIDQVQAAAIVSEAMHQLGKQLAQGASATKDSRQKTVRMRKTLLAPVETSQHRRVV